MPIVKTCDVTPDPEGRWRFRVEIHSSRIALNHALGLKSDETVEAMTVCDIDTDNGYIGTLYFHKHCLTVDVFAHEGVHAGLAWHCLMHNTLRLNVSPETTNWGGCEKIANKQEEALAMAVSGMVYQLTMQTKALTQLRIVPKRVAA